jgi:hypothetical protein
MYSPSQSCRTHDIAACKASRLECCPLTRPPEDNFPSAMRPNDCPCLDFWGKWSSMMQVSRKYACTFSAWGSDSKEVWVRGAFTRRMSARTLRKAYFHATTMHRSSTIMRHASSNRSGNIIFQISIRRVMCMLLAGQRCELGSRIACTTPRRVFQLP